MIYNSWFFFSPPNKNIPRDLVRISLVFSFLFFSEEFLFPSTRPTEREKKNRCKSISIYWIFRSVIIMSEQTKERVYVENKINEEKKEKKNVAQALQMSVLNEWMLAWSSLFQVIINASHLKWWFVVELCSHQGCLLMFSLRLFFAHRFGIFHKFNEILLKRTNEEEKKSSEHRSIYRKIKITYFIILNHTCSAAEWIGELRFQLNRIKLFYDIMILMLVAIWLVQLILIMLKFN